MRSMFLLVDGDPKDQLERLVEGYKEVFAKHNKDPLTRLEEAHIRSLCVALLSGQVPCVRVGPLPPPMQG